VSVGWRLCFARSHTFLSAQPRAIVHWMPVRFEWNGRQVELDEVDPHTTLLAWLRATGATGAKEGCAEGECGACAVAVIEQDGEGRSCYAPINSCLVPLPALHGRSLISVEGVAAVSGGLHPVQRALVEHAGSQCGYCTPGFVVSLFCEYYRPDRTGYDPEAISGNLCRCTGYRPIADAARALAARTVEDPKDPHLITLAHSDPRLPACAAQRGERYLRPTSLAELFALWSKHPEATLIAGGTDLMVYANQLGRRFQTLLALDALTELRQNQLETHAISLGAGTPLAHLEAWLARTAPVELHGFAQLLPLFSSRLIRLRATLGGSLATASPIGDAAPLLLALGAELSLASAAGTRRLPIADFFRGYRSHALAPGELITQVHVPRPTPRWQRFYKVSKRVLDDISSVAAAFVLDLDDTGRVTRFAAAYGGIAPTPLMAATLEPLALGRAWDRDTLARLCQALQRLGSPLSDQRASADYRAALVPRLLQKFYEDTTQAAQPALHAEVVA
jgi:xanthine dehydrogenase small subunit